MCGTSRDSEDHLDQRRDHRAYCELHELGYAHSVEAWLDDELVGGLYGVAVGGLFAGESMFFRETDASKVCLVHLVARLEERGFTLLDVQFVNEHLEQFGARSRSRTKNTSVGWPER